MPTVAAPRTPRSGSTTRAVVPEVPWSTPRTGRLTPPLRHAPGQGGTPEAVTSDGGELAGEGEVRRHRGERELGPDLRAAPPGHGRAGPLGPPRAGQGGDDDEAATGLGVR